MHLLSDNGTTLHSNSRHDEHKSSCIREAMHAHGRVQGVGFRYFARELASRLNLTGWVMNLPDGSVAMEIQGPKITIDTFAETLHAPMGGWGIHVTELTRKSLAVIPEEDSFQIRFWR